MPERSLILLRCVFVAAVDWYRTFCGLAGERAFTTFPRSADHSWCDGCAGLLLGYRPDDRQRSEGSSGRPAPYRLYRREPTHPQSTTTIHACGRPSSAELIHCCDPRQCLSHPSAPDDAGCCRWQVWPLVSGATKTSPRTHILVNANLLVTTDWKYVRPNQSMIEASWGGAQYPNGTTIASGNCAPQLLFLRPSCAAAPAYLLLLRPLRAAPGTYCRAVLCRAASLTPRLGRYRHVPASLWHVGLPLRPEERLHRAARGRRPAPAGRRDECVQPQTATAEPPQLRACV